MKVISLHVYDAAAYSASAVDKATTLSNFEYGLMVRCTMNGVFTVVVKHAFKGWIDAFEVVGSSESGLDSRVFPKSSNTYQIRMEFWCICHIVQSYGL